MRLLGRVGVFLALTISLFGAKLEVSNTQIVAGEKLIFRLSADGKDVKFPSIDEIDGFKVSKGGIQKSSSSSVQIINGKMSKEDKNTFLQDYIIYPTKDITIPAFVLDVDGAEQYTQRLKISVASQEQINQKLPYKISLHVENQNPYVGEIFKLSLKIELDERLDIGDIRLGENDFDGLFIKDKPIQKVKNEDGYKIIYLEYWASALKDGNLNIKPAQVHLGFASRNHDPFSIFGQSYDYKTIRSNPLALHVKPLPQGVNAVGDFEISASVDKEEVEAVKPVNVEVVIKGSGNLNEIESLKPKDANVTIYGDKPIVKSYMKNGVYKSKWSQKLAFVGSKDFTIEPFSFTYLDSKTAQIKTISTKPLHVKVKGSVSKSIQAQKSTIEKAKDDVVTDKKEALGWEWIVVSFLGGIFVSFVFIKFKNIKFKRQKIFKSDKDILQEILPYKDKDAELDSWIAKLESNVYGDKKEKIDKKRINTILEKLR
ncbi:MAG: BatD family protein [Campylobacteraceae bacterium]|nr:BatD family protein [Campylobacteraceae bacterium]